MLWDGKAGNAGRELEKDLMDQWQGREKGRGVGGGVMGREGRRAEDGMPRGGHQRWDGRRKGKEAGEDDVGRAKGRGEFEGRGKTEGRWGELDGGGRG